MAGDAVDIHVDPRWPGLQAGAGVSGAGPRSLLDIVPYASIIETAPGSHVCTPMRVENLRRQGLGSGSAPHCYYLIKKRPSQGRFEAVIYAPDWTRTSTPLRAQALNLLCIPIPPRGHIAIIHSFARFCQQGSSANFALAGVRCGPDVAGGSRKRAQGNTESAIEKGSSNLLLPFSLLCQSGPGVYGRARRSKLSKAQCAPGSSKGPHPKPI